MEKSNLEKLLKENTMSLFSNEWYSGISEKIIDLFNEDKKIGYVYFLRSEKSSYIKIGKSKDIDKRVKMLQHNVGKINILGFIYDEDYDFIEKELHTLFKDKRRHGEWFDLSIDDIKESIEGYTGTFLNTDASKVIISEGIFDLKSIDSDIQSEMFFTKCNDIIEFNKEYPNDYLNSIFKDFEFSSKRRFSLLKKWSIDKGVFLKQKNSNGIRRISFIK